MEAATLKTKKRTLNKNKIKKNIKNIICRPDPVIWPQITQDEEKRLQLTLTLHKIEIPEFKKPHWKKLKLIPKDQRPKPPKLKKVNGLYFGILECTSAVLNKQCSAVIIEAKVNPRMIVQPVIEACAKNEVPYICMMDLRTICSTNFGIPTSCLGVKSDTLPDLRNQILTIAQHHPIPQRKVDKIIVDENISEKEVTQSDNIPLYPYLYRTNKSSRVFIPTTQSKVSHVTKEFNGQNDYIKVNDKHELKRSHGYMRMTLKRISNNENRIKKK